MKTLALTTALIASLAVPAFASDSLARSLGVAPGAYSTGELIRLRQAIDDGDEIYEAFLRNGGSETVSTQSFGGNFGHDALARSLGVDGADYTTSQLIRLRQAVEDEDEAYEAFLRNGGNEVVSSQSFGHTNRAAEIFARFVIEEHDDGGS